MALCISAFFVIIFNNMPKELDVANLVVGFLDPILSTAS
jgi:hypothetical protein